MLWSARAGSTRFSRAGRERDDVIKYTLACDSGHEFESWFRDGAAYDTQAKRGLLACAICNSTRVRKAIMAPALGRSKRGAESPTEAAAADGAPRPVALLDERQQKLRGMMRALRNEIVAGTDDVGAKFPEEARRIHEGDSPARAIRGEASPAEARALMEEGIAVMPVPVLPEERN